MREEQKNLTMAQDDEVRMMTEGVFDKDKIKIENPRDWAMLADETIKKRIIREVDPKELEDVKLMWRGMDPRESLDLIFGKKDHFILSSDRPNVTTDRKIAIAYNQGDAENIRMNTALGFLPPFDCKVESALKKLPDDLSEEAFKYQRHLFTANGKINVVDLRYLMLRFVGKEIGKIPDPIYYEINWKKLVEMQKGREETANK